MECQFIGCRIIEHSLYFFKHNSSNLINNSKSKKSLHKIDKIDDLFISMRKGCLKIDKNHSITVEPQYSAHNWEISKSMLYQSVHYIEVLYNVTLKLNLNHSRHTI